MPRRRSATLQFNAIQLVGGLLPASLIEQIALQQAPQQKASDYALQKNQRLQVAVDQAWNRAKALWQEAQELRRRGEAMPWAAWFSEQLLEQVFGWADLGPCPRRQIAEASFPITHQALFRQLLRLVYRLLFLCVAEDRNLLFAADVPLELRQIYREGYSLSPLRDLAIRSGAHKQLHGDLWLVQKLVFDQTFVVKGQPDLFTANAMTQVLPSAVGFEAIEENDLAAVRRKEWAYQAWRNDPAIRQELQRADAYTAAFFLPKQEGKEHLVPLSQNLDAIQRGAELSGPMAEAVAKAADDFRFLHWHLAFPDVMRAGGFDCLLGNPPWERIKLQEKEFFLAGYRPRN